jgi:hypothetical protein
VAFLYRGHLYHGIKRFFGFYAMALFLRVYGILKSVIS